MLNKIYLFIYLFFITNDLYNGKSQLTQQYKTDFNIDSSIANNWTRNVYHVIWFVANFTYFRRKNESRIEWYKKYNE